MRVRQRLPASALGLALAAAVRCASPAPAGAAEAGPPRAAAVTVSCKDGRVTLSARAAPAPAVFRALEKECGLALRRPELVPDEPVTIEVRGKTLEEAVTDLVRLTGVPSTLAATSVAEPMTLVLLPTGTGDMPRTAPDPPPAGEVGEEGGRDREAAARRGEQRRLLARIRALAPDEAWVLEGLSLPSLLRLWNDAATEDALLRFLASGSAEERRRILEELRAIGPAPGTEAPWSAEEVDNHRWSLGWRQAERDYLLADGEAARGQALRALRESNPEVAEDLGKLSPEALGEERTRAETAALRDRYLLLRSRAEWEELYRSRDKKTPPSPP